MDKNTIDTIERELLCEATIEDMINDGQLEGHQEIRGARLTLIYLRRMFQQAEILELTP